MFVNALYNIISRVLLGRTLGALGIAGISILFPLGLVFVGFSALIGVGANALFSIRLGEQNEDEAQHILGNAFVLLALISTAVKQCKYILSNNKNRVPVLTLIYYILFYKLKIAYHKLGGNICKIMGLH